MGDRGYCGDVCWLRRQPPRSLVSDDSDRGCAGFGSSLSSDISELESIGAGGTDPGFAEELADLDVPADDK